MTRVSSYQQRDNNNRIGGWSELVRCGDGEYKWCIPSAPGRSGNVPSIKPESSNNNPYRESTLME